jgi:hypothetical protein
MDRRVLRVVVASPGDVACERDAVAKVFDEVNRGIARDKNILCEVWRWETDAYPRFHPEGAQGAIDQVLRIDDCDLLIGIFWKRFGTPLKGAASGTEHEIRLAHEAWRAKQRPQVMLYFSQQPYSPRREEVEQWGKVLDFKEEFQDVGLLWSYPGPESFEAQFRQHATNFLLNFGKSAPSNPAGTPDADALLRALTAATRQGAAVLPADRVNELGAGLGLEAGTVLGIVEHLRRAGAVQVHWGGGVSVRAPDRGLKT